MAQRLEVAPGVILLAGHLDAQAQRALAAAAAAVIGAAPLYRPTMPGTGQPWSVRMTSCGPLGWVSDVAGYRYQPRHPETGAPWPPIPQRLLALWEQATGYPAPPESCLVNFYGAGARMGLHRDADEAALDAPVLSVSLGDEAVFRLGGLRRRDRTRSFRLRSGDVLLLGGANRLAYHGIDRVIAGTSPLLETGGRINLTLRRVTEPARDGEGGNHGHGA